MKYLSHVRKFALRNARFLVLLMLYVCGWWGIVYSGYATEVLSLMPVVLFITWLVYFGPHIRRKGAMVSFVEIYLLAMLVEIIGVAYGYPFGIYHYTEVLGPSIFGVPFIIGINWYIAICGSYSIAYYLTNASFWKYHKGIIILFSGIATVVYDLALEPFAIRYHLWKWPGDVVPLSNYISWFVLGIIMSIIIHKHRDQHAWQPFVWLWCLQIIFFVAVVIGSQA